MRKKVTRFLSMSLSLAMIFTNNFMPVSTYAATDNSEENVMYADNMAYDKTTGHLYKLTSEEGNYERVLALAKESGGYLACISNARENDIVANVISEQGANTSSYIGLIRNEENLDEWLWADGSEVSYTNWNDGEPNNKNEKAGEVYDNKRSNGAGKWNDCNTTSLRTGVIEYDSCIHPKSQNVIKDRTLADCEQGGYTGDVYCGFCNEKISDGEEIEARGHSDAVLDESTVKEATCTETGYSGDKICPVCDKVLEQGEVLKANGHKEAEQVRNAKKSSCYQKGYTGDKYCEVCDETLQEGEAIPKLEHEYENDVCKNCGRVNNAQVDVTYSLTKTIDYPYTVFQFTAPESGGYTFTGDSEWDSYGYLYKADKFNDSVISAGMEMYYAKLKDNNASTPRLKDYWKSDDDSGIGPAPKITAELTKGETYYFVFGPYITEYGDFKLTITCAHTKTHVEGRTLESCEQGGYTGDVVCDICGKVIENGTTVEPSEHTPGDLENARENSCYLDGYTGDKYCTVCNTQLQQGEVIPKLEHEYEDDVCKNCGRVNNAELDITYTSKTTKDYPYTVFQFTAPESGRYTFTGDSDWDSYGYLYRADKFNDSVISAGMEMYYARLKDNNASRPQLKNYWIGNDGGNNLAPKINVELTKGETYYFVFGPYSTEYGDFKLTITCVHTKTHVEGRTLENCEQGGYTGDVVCDTCGKVIENGTTVEPSEHTPGDLENARVNSCYLDGYTGDKHCTVCNMQLQQGEVIPKFEHEYETDVCKNCGRIKNVQKNKVYDTQITKDLPIQVIEYTADKDEYVSFYCSNKTGWDSYGFLFDSENYSDEMIRNELDKFFDEDEYKIRFNNALDSDDDGGNNGAPQVEYELTKGEKYYFVVVPYGYNDEYEYGEFTITVGCAHYNIHVENKTINSCEEGGYTGDIICDDCGETVEEGVTIEPHSEHSYYEYNRKDATCNEYAKTYYRCRYCNAKKTEIDTNAGYGSHKYEFVGSIEATCTTDGYLGDYKCIYCGEESENQPTNKIIKAYHDYPEGSRNQYFIYDYNMVKATCEKDGYTGDVYCPICKETIEKGKVINKLGHSFKDGVCEECGAEEEFVKQQKDGYFEITTFEDLILYLKNIYSGINGKLMSDITFPENYEDEDDLIGNVNAVNIIFDGNGHSISGINQRGENRPLFNFVYSSEIKNINIKYVNENFTSGMAADIAIGAKNSVFRNCSVSGNKNLNNLNDCLSAMVCFADNCKFIGCTNNANVTGTGSGGTAAGIAYIITENTIVEDCVNNGKLSMQNGMAAGIAVNVYSSTIKNCINNGSINGYNIASGIVIDVQGELIPGTTEISGCINKGRIEANSYYDHYASGICSKYKGNFDSPGKLIISNCVNEGYVKGGTVAGIICEANGKLEITSCENNGNIDGDDSAAGICEYINNTKNHNKIKISNCKNNGDISAESAAGIVDYGYYFDINNCINNGNILSDRCGGGILAYVYGVNGSELINNGDINAYEYAGGICAYDEGKSTYDKLYNSGKIDTRNIAADKNSLVNSDEEINVTNSEEKHVHNYDSEANIIKATLEADGYREFKCYCGDSKKIAISRIDSVNISNEKYEYTGNSIALPTVTVTDAAGEIVSDQYYTVTFKNKTTGAAVTEIKDAGTYEVIVTFNTLYEGEVAKEITVVNNSGTTPADTTPGGTNNSGTTNVSNSDTTNKTDNDNSVTKPGKVKKVTTKVNKKKSVIIKWRKQKAVTGYQIRYSVNKKMKKAKIKTITKNNAKTVLKKLKPGKYFVQIRAYKVVNGKKVAGKWSSKKVVKVSK